MMKKHLQFVLAALLTFICFTNNLLAQTNVALNQTAIASSIESSAYPASGAIDGNGSTRWSSTFNNNQWIYIDLGEAYNLTEVRLTWETARGLDFDIDISNDAITWITVQSIRGNSDFNNVIDVSGYAARYVRMNGLVRATQYGFSLFEFEVYGVPVDDTPIVNLALNKSSSVSSLENATMLSAYAFDGLGTNVGAGGKAYDGSSVEYGRWASEYSDPQWISVDLGGVYEIREIRLFWEVANGMNFNIEVSDDNVNWTSVAGIINNSANQYINHIPVPIGTTAQYVRMYGITRNTGYGYSLYEFQVMGVNSILPINLVSFSVSKKENSAVISWDAALDKESKFEIQRSNDGISFSTIGSKHELTGSNGIVNHYSFVDQSPVNGINYYRIAYSEANGGRLFTRIEAISFGASSRLKVYPNPVTRDVNLLRIEIPDQIAGKTQVRIINMAGVVVKQQQFAEGNTILLVEGISKLVKGQYIVQVLPEKSAPVSKMIIVR
ncbi:hypothetical protein DC498_12550 [Terrimonas sp.]|uniref:discoidin domain-containing protein n=1 Tax=Terrimonas sp. TaxID=1914338 RepID=UPI000D510D49|nr:discoidin domain-containing protein [Terrimonas sp.]PVD51873.1 hypothetical protein DC498_12550 [Terrimonas sp.]